MAVPQEKLFWTVEEYLEFEKTSDVRHEYVDGAIYAMAGNKARHYRLIQTFVRGLENVLSPGKCEVFATDMKTRVSDSLYYYPDVVVTCEQLEDEDDEVTQPVLIIEILSPSTAAIDRREKLLEYKRLPSLQEYATVWQDKTRIELHRRTNETEWTTFLFQQPDDAVEFASVGLNLRISKVYRNTNFNV